MARVIRIVLTFLQKPSRIPSDRQSKMLSATEKGTGFRWRCLEGATPDSVRLFEFNKEPEPKRQPWISNIT